MTSTKAKTLIPLLSGRLNEIFPEMEDRRAINQTGALNDILTGIVNGKLVIVTVLDRESPPNFTTQIR